MTDDGQSFLCKLNKEEVESLTSFKLLRWVLKKVR